MTLEEVSAVMGVSRQRVEQIERQAIAKLRRILEARHLTFADLSLPEGKDFNHLSVTYRDDRPARPAVSAPPAKAPPAAPAPSADALPAPSGTRCCTLCHTEKPTSEFPLNSRKSGYRHQCKACMSKRAMAHHQAKRGTAQF